MSCSSHSPPASHTGQSSGWFASSISSMDLRACLTSGLSVVTVMPSLITVVQAVCSFGIFSILTRHMRQAPWRDKIGVIAKGGHFNAHRLLQASIRSVPLER